MTDLARQLRRWIDAGLITDEQGDAILRHEQRAAGNESDTVPSMQRTPPPSSAPPAAERADRRTRSAEAVGYVGAALAIGAIGLLLGELWDELLVGGRLALVAVLTVLLAGGGLALRRTDSPPIQRLASVLFTGAVIGVGWFAFILGDDVLELAESDVMLVVGLAATAAALPAYLGRRRALPQVTLLAATLLTVGALLTRSPMTPDPLWVGLLFWALGIAWLLLGTGGWLVPRRVAEITGGVVGLLAAQVASVGDARLIGLVLAVSTAGALVVLAITSDRVHHLAVGSVGLFVLVPQLVFEIFGDAIGAPATLLVVGLLLVVLAVGIGRARREVTPSSAPPGPHPDREDRAADRTVGGESR